MCFTAYSEISGWWPHLFDSLDLFTQLYAVPSGVLTSLFTHAVGPPYNNFKLPFYSLNSKKQWMLLGNENNSVWSFSAVGWLQPQPRTNKTWQKRCFQSSVSATKTRRDRLFHFSAINTLHHPDSAINCSPSGHVRLFLSTWDCNDCTASFILPFLIRAQKKKGEIWAIKQEYCKEASLCRSGCDADLTWRVCVFSVRIPVTAAKWLRPHLILDTTPEGLNSDRPNSVGGIISGVEDSDSLGPFPRMP